MSDRLEQELRQTLAKRAARVEVPSGFEDMVIRRTRRQRLRQRVAVTTAVAVVSILAVGLAALVMATGEPQGDRVSTGPPNREAGWRQMPDAPMGIGSRYGAVWTGTQLIAWGATDPDATTAAGAAYRPDDNVWTPLSPSPLSPRHGHSAVWTGTEVIFWGGTTSPYSDDDLADGAAYNPATDTWRLLPTAPMAASGHEAVWTGREMIVWGGALSSIDSVVLAPGAAAYDPASNAWRTLTDVPQPWSGDDGPAVTVTHEGRMFVWRREFLGVYDPTTDEWRLVESPDVPDSGCSVTGGPVSVGALTRRGLLIWTGGCDPTNGFLYDPAEDNWTTVADSDLIDFDPVIVAAGDGVYAATRRGDGSTVPRLLHFSLDTERWTELPDPPVRFGLRSFLAWTGEQLIVWGGFDERGELSSGAVYRPGTQQTQTSDASTAPKSECDRARGPDSTVVRAYYTTVGGVRRWQQRAGRDRRETLQ